MNPIWVEDDLIFIRAVTFYPASGNRDCTSGGFNAVGTHGYCWHCAINGINTYWLRLMSTDVGPTSSNNRAYGIPVRCVQVLLTCFV
jgi:hypothetical protein